MTIKRAETPMSLRIDQAANGYIAVEVAHPHDVFVTSEARVFPSKAALFAHLAAHFTHEAVSVPMDKAPPMVTTSRDQVHVGPMTAEGIAALQDHVWSAIDPNMPAGDAVGFTKFGRRE